MRTLGGFCFALLFATGVYAQKQTGGFATPMPATRTFGSVLNPAGGSGLPGVTRTTGSVLYPGGSSPQIVVPGVRLQGAPPAGGHRRGNGSIAYPVAVPVYVGSYPYGYGYETMAPAQPPVPAQPQQPNVIVVYPPAPAYVYGPPQSTVVEVPREQTEIREERVEPEHYLIAFKDRSIYSAVAYWVDGDTIHYFTSGNTHNQASLSLLDRDLTKRLNSSGLEVKLPAEK